MKFRHIILGTLAVLTLSFTTPKQDPPGKTFSLVYVDNSKFAGRLSLSEGMIERMLKIMDTVKADNHSLSFFLSNYAKPDYVRNPAQAVKLINNIYNGYAGQPNSLADKKLLNDRLFSEDLSGFGAVNVYFFVTENYLQSDLLGENRGLLLNFLPKQLESLTNCPAEQITVTVFYPKGSQSVQNSSIQSFTSFAAASKDLRSKIKFHFLAI